MSFIGGGNIDRRFRTVGTRGANRLLSSGQVPDLAQILRPPPPPPPATASHQPPTTMSATPSSFPYASRYVTPIHQPMTTVSSSSSLPVTPPQPKIPKVNVFSNDGSFLEKFHKFKRVCIRIPLDCNIPGKSITNDLDVGRKNSKRRNRRISYNGVSLHALELP